MFFPTLKRALILAAHTDDEFGCAGTIARLVASGAEVRYVAFSQCQESVPAGFPDDVLGKECRACTAMLGIAPENVTLLDYRVRRFPEVRQELLEYLYRLNGDWRPEIVLMPSSYDQHQDHQVVHQETVRAFKHATILGYELPQNNISFENSAFVRLTKTDLQRKIEALSCYRSQAFRPYSNDEYIRSLAMVRGVQCGATYAEAFEAVRVVIP